MQQGAVALFVVLFNGGHQTEPLGQLLEALFLGGFGKALVHIGPLVVFTVSGGGKILGGGADAVQLLEPELCVLLLVFGGFQEQGRDLLIAFLLGLGSEIGVFVACLRFAGKGCQQVLFGLGACVFAHHSFDLSEWNSPTGAARPL